MRIRTLLLAGTVASAAVAAAAVGTVIVAARTLDRALAEAGAARAIVAAVFEQSEILSDYLLHPGERARVQWERKNDSIGRLLDGMAAPRGDGGALLAQMRESHRKKSEGFARLLASFDTRLAEANRTGTLSEQQEHRVAQLRSAAQSMHALAARMGRDAESRLAATLDRLALGGAALVAAMAALLAGVWFIVGWRVMRPVERLRQGIRGYRGGRVVAWPGVRDDEIGDVAQAFAQMTRNLDALMVSRDELTREVETRAAAERRAREFAETLKARSAELDAVNRELESFAYSVSHDLRAPLRSLSGFSAALAEDCADRLDADGKDYVRRIEAASRRMGQLIDDLLKLSQVTRAEFKRAEVDLSAIAAAVAEQVRRNDPGRNVEFRIQPGATARGDEMLLRTVLENLLGNAWKYSAKKKRATIEFGVEANGASPVFYVRDDGAGFDPAYADKLFKPFQRLHSASEFEGTGIGLASVANIVRRHGGRIWADSAPGAGTTMRFTLAPG